MTFKNIRESKTTKIFTSYLAIQFLLQIVQPTAIWALTGGPKQPEFNSFTPIGTSDMVDLSSGDFSYNIPIMDVGGYPINLSYQSGITMDQEASWVGLGWNMNVGQISRNVRGIPDDFMGDVMAYTDESKENKTIGVSAFVNAAIFGFDKKKPKFKGDKRSVSLDFGVGLEMQHNTYSGTTATFSLGPTFAINNGASVGFNLSGSQSGGASITPSIGYSKTLKDGIIDKTTFNSSVGVTHNSRQGLTSFNLSASIKETELDYNEKKKENFDRTVNSASASGSISFAKPSFTPRKRVSVENSSYTFSFAAGGEVFGLEIDGRLTGSVSTQRGRNPFHTEHAFGYEHTDFAGGNDVLDFNRQNDRTISLNTNALATTNYTYDLYNIQGQGIGGQFRPYRSQVGYVFDNFVRDDGHGISIGVEIGGGNLVHVGLDANGTITRGHTGVWASENSAINKLSETTGGTTSEYEKVYFKGVGQLDVDDDAIHLLKTQLGGEEAITFGVRGNGKLSNQYRSDASNIGNTGIIRRDNRAKRNQVIEKLTFKDVKDRINTTLPRDIEDDLFFDYRSDLDGIRKLHHTAGFKILQPDGSFYNYGLAVYNTKKVEATFDVAGANQDPEDRKKGLIAASSKRSKTGSDNFLSKVETPAYPHTHLLTSILSSDYEDLNGNGKPDDEDLGSYTKFSYTKEADHHDPYKWRIPYESSKSTFNEGLETLRNDQKANYLYGEKELFYLNKIETKTHVAIFDLVGRADGLGAYGETHSSGSRKRLQRIKSIRLFSKPELAKHNFNPDNATPIKTAHFEYNYNLCQGIDNNDGRDDLNDNGKFDDDNVRNGKLTLEKVYFTYADSQMGKYAPYKFDYEADNANLNPSYHVKSYDIWSNYKPFTNGNNNPNIGPTGELTGAQFPYVQQANRGLQDNYAQAWSLQKIDLPSGGQIDLEYESDSYAYVQDKKAMRMFKIKGFKELNKGDLEGASHVIVELDQDDKNNAAFTANDFKRLYLGESQYKPIYFRTMLNMKSETRENSYDFVTGYLKIDNGRDIILHDGHAQIPVQLLKQGDGGIVGGSDVHPIRKSGWYFGRKYMNTIVFGGSEYSGSVKSIAKSLVGAISSFAEILKGANGVLRKRGIARYAILNKSWIRLQNPRNEKLGGGSRIKTLKMYDNWDEMAGTQHQNKFYGQRYDYLLKNGKSSGVATFEPNESKENPLVLPFYDDDDRMVAPASENYVETPLGGEFYPASKVTYSRVQVTTLNNGENSKTIKRHRSGAVVSEFYTSRDFPTITKVTNLDRNKKHKTPAFGGLLKVVSHEELTLAQGFSIITNDMDGKMHKQSVHSENMEEKDHLKLGPLISSVTYEYNVSPSNPRQLDNHLKVVDEHGRVDTKIVGVDYDVINDFRESKSETHRVGIKGNLGVFLALFFPVAIPSIFPEYNNIRSNMYSATTTKVIHKRGILKKKIAYDLGAKVETENIAWDANTGQVLLTKTVNEFDDHYYNLNYPAYWMYEGMGLAYENLKIKGVANEGASSGADYFWSSETNNFNKGDVLLLDKEQVPEIKIDDVTFNGPIKLWVTDVKTNGDFSLMTVTGATVNQIQECTTNNAPKGVEGLPSQFKYEIIRSGKRNLQTANMASITTKTYPIIYDNVLGHEKLINFASGNNQVVNASAVEYSDFWKPQEELDMPQLSSGLAETYFQNANDNGIYTLTEELPSHNYGFNPYLYNVRGNYKANKSYAYLGTRTNDVTANPNIRTNGIFSNDFSAFYTYSNNNWRVESNNKAKWTSASQVTQLSPYGFEIENKDALNRYSSAEYGYDHTLPTAVASNSKYQEIAFNGFEDYHEIPDKLDYKKRKFEPEIVNENTNKFGISDKTSHSGRCSIKVTPNNQANISRFIQPVEIVQGERPCLENQNLTFTVENDAPERVSFEGDLEPFSRIVNNRFIYINIFGGAPYQYIKYSIRAKQKEGSDISQSILLVAQDPEKLTKIDNSIRDISPSDNGEMNSFCQELSNTLRENNNLNKMLIHRSSVHKTGSNRDKVSRVIETHEKEGYFYLNGNGELSLELNQGIRLYHQSYSDAYPANYMWDFAYHCPTGNQDDCYKYEYLSGFEIFHRNNTNATVEIELSYKDSNGIERSSTFQNVFTIDNEVLSQTIHDEVTNNTFKEHPSINNPFPTY